MGACLSMACCWISTREGRVSPLLAKIFYCILFVLCMALGLFVRADTGGYLIKLDKYTKSGCDKDDHGCLGRTAVYRLGLSLACFHAAMAIITLTKSAAAQGGFWILKLGFLIALFVGTFFIPVSSLNQFAMSCRFFSALFLLVQVILLVDFSYAWNEAWVQRGWLKSILFSAFTLYVFFITTVVLSYVWYTRHGPCGGHTAIVSIGLVLSIVVSLGSLFVEHGALLPSAVVSLQSAYTIFGGLSGTRGQCGEGAGSSASGQWWVLLGTLFLTMVSLAYAAMSAGSSSGAFSLSSGDAGSGAREKLKPFDPEAGKSAEVSKEKSDLVVEEEADPGYSYSFFHCIFFLAAAYSTMLLTAWGSLTSDPDKYSIHEGDIGLWVRAISAYVTCIMYGWSLIAPSVLRNRSFD